MLFLICFYTVPQSVLQILHLMQDMSFFDKETVGSLTSRISADCQRLSHTIGKDIHLILRNTFQVYYSG